MPLELNLSTGELLIFKPGLPSGYSGPVLQGATASHATSNTVKLVVQELVTELYTIRFSLANILKKITAMSLLPANGLYSYFMLKNNLRKQIGSIGKLHLRQDQYCLFYTEETACKSTFEKNNDFRTIDIYYTPQLVRELVPFFPGLEEVLNAASTALPGKACWSLPSMMEITNQLLNCEYNESTRQFYFDLKVRELLYQLLENTYSRKPGAHQFTPWEVARIHEAKKILMEHVSKKPPTIRKLARQVALNEFKLKTGFRQYFNMGMFEWLIEQKMRYAKELILTTNKPIKDICTMVGYPRVTNFITAFRRRFGNSPGALRR
jgi:AraC-like DNA-binding protein